MESGIRANGAALEYGVSLVTELKGQYILVNFA